MDRHPGRGVLGDVVPLPLEFLRFSRVSGCKIVQYLSLKQSFFNLNEVCFGFESQILKNLTNLLL